ERRWRRSILGASLGAVDLDGYALGVRSRVDQVERDVRATFGEQPYTLAEEDGDDQQGHLIDEIPFEQPANQSAAAVYLQLPARLGFQLPDLRFDVSRKDGRPRPLRVGDCVRYDVLGLLVQRLTDGVDTHVCDFS